MIFFIPVMAVIYILLKETVNGRIERRKAAQQAESMESILEESIQAMDEEDEQEQ